MQQSNVIAACLFIAFIVFITMRGKLPQYLQALLGTNQAPAASGGSGGASSAVDGLINQGLSNIPVVGPGIAAIGGAASSVRTGILNAIGVPHL